MLQAKREKTNAFEEEVKLEKKKKKKEKKERKRMKRITYRREESIP